MQKETIEIERNENFSFGYGSLSQLHESSPKVLDKLVEWSQTNDHTIYKHIVEYTQEKAGELGEYDFSTGWTPFNERPKVFKCHRIGRLTIYYQ